MQLPRQYWLFLSIFRKIKLQLQVAGWDVSVQRPVLYLPSNFKTRISRYLDQVLIFACDTYLTAWQLPWECSGPPSRLCVTAHLYFYLQLMNLSQGAMENGNVLYEFSRVRRERKGKHFHSWQPSGTLVLLVFLTPGFSFFWRWGGGGKGGRVWIHLGFSCQTCIESLSEKKNLFVPPLRLEQWHDVRGKGTVITHHYPGGIKVSLCSCSARKATQIAEVLSMSWAQGNILVENCLFKIKRSYFCIIWLGLF